MVENQTTEVTAPQTPPEVPQQKVDEKLIPQSEVNTLIGSVKHNSYQKGYQQALTELQTQQKPQEPQQHANVGDENLRKIVADEFSKQQQAAREKMLREQQEAEGKRVLGELTAKINAAAPKYPDFDEVTKQIDFSQIPEVLHYANLVDNSGDVLYDLAKNPGKIATLRGLPPKVAAQEMLRMSASIKQNQEAAQQAAPRDPLNQIKPSNIDIGKGPKTPADFRNSFKGKY